MGSCGGNMDVASAVTLLDGGRRGVGFVWFAYGLGHSGKGLAEELTLLTVSAVAVYGGGYGCWRFARALDARSRHAGG